MAACSVLQTWRLYFFLTFVVVGILGLWFVIRPELTDFQTVYLRLNEVIERVKGNKTKTDIPSTDNKLNKTYRGVQNVEVTGPGFVPCKGNATWDAYGESGCPDNSRRENFCHLFRAWITAARKYNVSYTLGYGSLVGVLRNNDLIPWDTDIDININVKYFPLLEKWEKEKMFTKLDGAIRLATQPGPVNNVPEEKRTRHNCQGQVGLLVNYSQNCLLFIVEYEYCNTRCSLITVVRPCLGWEQMGIPPLYPSNFFLDVM